MKAKRPRSGVSYQLGLSHEEVTNTSVRSASQEASGKSAADGQGTS